MRKLGRIAVGGMVAFGLMSAVPAAVFAAQPACGDTLTSNTTLTADLDCSGTDSTGVYMGKNGIVLDLNGYTIWGFTGADSDTGVDTNGYNHTTIKNGAIANFGTGVYASYVQDTLVKNVEVYGELADTSSEGIYFYYGAGNRAINVNLHDLYYAFDTEYTADSQLLNSTAVENEYAVYAYYDSHDRFQSNKLNNNAYGAYDEYSGNNRYTSNTAKNNTYEGFYVYCDSYGIVTLKNNVAMNNGSEGFYTYDCYADNGYAPGNGSVFTGNTASGNASEGFYDYYSINSVWTGNTATNNDGGGIYVDYPGGFTMTSNVANGNGANGFYFYDNYSSGYYNLYNFSNNKANNNDLYGFDADYGVPGKGNTGHGNSSGNCYNVRCN